MAYSGKVDVLRTGPRDAYSQAAVHEDLVRKTKNKTYQKPEMEDAE